MKIYTSIKQFYRPIQPSVQLEGNDATYVEIFPHSSIQPFIFCYWQLKTDRPLDSQYSYRVVTDGCIDIFFEANNPAENFLMGFTTTCTEFPLGTSFHYIGIRFFPTVFPQLFRIDAGELTNRFEYLDNIVPDLSGYIATVFEESPSPFQIKSSFDKYFLNLIRNKEFLPDHRVSMALEIILRNGGNLTLKNDLEIGLSRRQLRRLFNTYIGGNVKTFTKIVRFQNVLKTLMKTKRMHKSTPVTDAGYYDQAHFIKEFKTFYGSTPSQL